LERDALLEGLKKLSPAEIAEIVLKTVSAEQLAEAVKEADDETQAMVLEAILSKNLGTKTLEVQNAHIPSCAREFPIINDKGEVLMFWRKKGVRYPECWHISGSTRNARKLMEQEGVTPFESVVSKYGMSGAELGSPQYAGFVEVQHGNGRTQCSFGEVWTQLRLVHYRRGDIPENARWFSRDNLPDDTLPYHKDVLVPKLNTIIDSPGIFDRAFL